MDQPKFADGIPVHCSHAMIELVKNLRPNLRKPESILLPWEMTPFWGWESDGKEEDIPECDLVPF